MKAGNEIRSAVNNIRYYTNKIEAATKQQFEADAQLPEMNTNVGSVRFDCLGAMETACSWMLTYCDNIETNLSSAEKYDKLLHSKEKE